VCTALSEEQEMVVNQALQGGLADQVFVEAFKLQIRRCDIATLCDRTWLNDQVYDFYVCIWGDILWKL